MTLEPPRALLAGWCEEFTGFVLDTIAQLGQTPAQGELGAEGERIADAVSVPIAEEPLAEGSAGIIERLEHACGAGLMTTHPGYLAYVPGGGLPTAALAMFVAGALNRYTGIAAASAALNRLETDVLRWLIDEFAFGPHARGLLTTGGSMANFSAVVAARHHTFAANGDYRDAMVYTSHQAHHSVRKAAMLAGIPPANVRSLATDERLRLDVAALEAEISRDLQRGRRPFLVVSAAGTTNTGAIDPLEAIGEVCRDHGLWHHVDAAYGGAFILCEAGRERLRGISSADSVAFDPHKGMFLPYGIGCLLVREGERLRQAHRSEAEYLQDLTVPDDSRAFSPADYGPELSRGFRGLQLWLPLMLHGARPFREALTEKLALTESLYDKLVALQAEGLPLELVDPPQLTTIAFRLTRRADESLEDWSKRNGALLRAINGGQRVHLSSTQLPLKTGTVATLRACILCFRTHAPEIEAAATAIERALRSSGDAQP